jgi:hypothetical protein
MALARCRSCNREIDWVKTRNGKNMPIDIGQRLGGNVVIGEDGVASVTTPHPDLMGYVSHFTTCPDADEHRRNR